MRLRFNDLSRQEIFRWNSFALHRGSSRPGSTCLGQRADEHDAMWILAGGAIFLVGTLGVTALRNVPRNDELEAMPATGRVAAELWSRYLREWAFWNHVRSGSALVAAALLTFALVNK
jgi:uncharacterized membrane protein